jgi:hypothetical protein
MKEEGTQMERYNPKKNSSLFSVYKSLLREA